MKSNDIQKWVERFEELNPDNQLQLADAICKELKFNAKCLEDDCYTIKSNALVEFFRQYIEDIKEKGNLEELNSILNRFNQLSVEHQNNLIKRFIPSLDHKLKEEEYVQNRIICNEIGHDFDNWIKRIHYTAKEYHSPELSDFTDSGKKVVVEETVWFHKCKRCGYEETRKNRPYRKSKTITKK